MSQLLILLNSPVQVIFNDLFIALTWLGLFAAIFFAYYYYMKARNQERMAMIEKGSDLSELYQAKPKRSFKFPWFKLIFTIMGIGIGGFSGMIFGSIIGRNNHYIDVEPLIFLVILFFGAIGMLFGHFFDLRANKKQSTEN